MVLNNIISYKCGQINLSESNQYKGERKLRVNVKFQNKIGNHKEFGNYRILEDYIMRRCKSRV